MKSDSQRRRIHVERASGLSYLHASDVAQPDYVALRGREALNRGEDPRMNVRSREVRVGAAKRRRVDL